MRGVVAASKFGKSTLPNVLGALDRPNVREVIIAGSALSARVGLGKRIDGTPNETSRGVGSRRATPLQGTACSCSN